MRTKIDQLATQYYSDMDPDALAAPKVMDGDVLRFRKNRVVDFLLAEARTGRGCDLNELWLFAQSAGIYREEMQEFYRLIGYSLGGYCEITWTRLKKRPRTR